MKDICFLPPIPSEIIRRCCATWFIFPSPTRVRWPAVPPDVCPAATVGLPSLTVCVCVSACFCVFWHKTHLFLAARSIRKQGHRYSSAQRITGSTHAYLELSFHPSKIWPLSAIHLCPLRALVASLITFSESERKRIMSGMVPLYLLHFFLSRGLKKRHGDRVWNRQRERKRWWGLVGCKWGEMTDWNEELRGWIMEARDLTEEEGMRMGWLSSWRQVAVETALFFQTDRQTDGGWLLSVWMWKGYVGMRQQRPRPSAHTLICSALMVWYS